MKNSKYVESWWIEVLPNGIYHLLFNLTERWLPYHKYNDTEFIFGGDIEGEEYEDWLSRIQEVPVFLPEDKGVIWLSSSHLEKDQLSYYFIPYKKEWVREGDKILFSSDKLGEALK